MKRKADLMATSSKKDIERAIVAAINEDSDGELRALVMSIPERVEQTVRELTPILTGETERSIEVKSRKSEYKRIGTRRIKIGDVFSDDDPVRVNAIEYGRKKGDHGTTPEFAMFRKAAAIWQQVEL